MINNLFNPNDPNLYLTTYSVAEVADILSCGKNYIYELLNSGKLHGFRQGKSTWRIPQKALIDYIKHVANI